MMHYGILVLVLPAGQLPICFAYRPKQIFNWSVAQRDVVLLSKLFRRPHRLRVQVRDNGEFFIIEHR
jgi:hypothetical protein